MIRQKSINFINLFTAFLKSPTINNPLSYKKIYKTENDRKRFCKLRVLELRNNKGIG